MDDVVKLYKPMEGLMAGSPFFKGGGVVDINAVFSGEIAI